MEAYAQVIWKFSSKRFEKDKEMDTQDQKRRPRKKYPARIWLFGLFIILLAISVMIAIYTQGEWMAVLSLILTSLGLVLTAWQWAYSSSLQKEDQTPVNASTKSVVRLATNKKDFINFQDQCKAKLCGNNFGGLVIYGNEATVGCVAIIFVQPLDNITPYRQLLETSPMPANDNISPDIKTAYIARHQINNSSYVYAAVFLNLNLATYHVELHSKPGLPPLNNTVIDIHSDQVSVIDWQDAMLNFA